LCNKAKRTTITSTIGAITSTDPNPFTQLILDFRGKNLPSEQIKADYNNTLNYPNNYFVAPKRWRECFYTTSRKNMPSLSEGLENIVRVNRFILNY
jgi:hypothetical protein